MRKHGRTDDNQSEIVSALRAIGCSVQSLAALGNGCPDLMIARNGVNYLLECKNGQLAPSGQALTVMEKLWIENWKGRVAVVNSVESALAAVGAKVQ